MPQRQRAYLAFCSAVLFITLSCVKQSLARRWGDTVALDRILLMKKRLELIPAYVVFAISLNFFFIDFIFNTVVNTPSV